MDFVRFAARLEEERERLGLSKSELARQIGVSNQSIANYANGKAPKTEVLQRMGQIGLDVQYLLFGLRSPNADQVVPPGFTIGVVEGVGVAMPGSNVNVVNTRTHVTRTVAEVKPGDIHITDKEATILQKLVTDVFETEAKLKKKPASMRSIWSRLNAHCQVPKYRLIKREDFEKARSYLTQWLARLASMPTAPVKDADSWRKRHYAYIKINTKQPQDAAAFQAYMKREFKATSLTDLSNDELDRVYRYVAGRRNKARR